MSCKISIIKLIAIAAVMLSGCTNDSDVLPEGEGGTMTFQLSTRAGNGIGEGQQVRLFVAERAQEHSGYPEKDPVSSDDVNKFHPYVPDGEDPYEIYGQPEEDLHVVETIDLGGSSYQVTGLYGQWYKFAFVCTPTVGGELFGPETEANEEPNHDFGECYIDYEPVLEHQSNLNAAQGKDLAIYRKVIDRWADASSPLTEDVTLTRQTGELVLNMGIPEDQFDGEVDHFVITLQTPTQMYVRDMARDSVLIAAVPSEHTFTWIVTDQSEEQEIHISLLPDVKPDFKPLAEGDDDEGETPAVTDERRLYYLAVQAYADAEENTLIPFKDIEGNGKTIAVIQDINDSDEDSETYDRNILIRKNIRTTVLFNGMTTEQFEVRYAGFDNNAVVDVDDDAWDGEN